VPSTTPPKKPRVYEVAKDLGMSSEAVLQIVRRMGVEVKNHMSTLSTEAVEKVQAEMAHERTAVREEQARKHEQELQRAREERARAAAAQAAAAAATAAPAAPARPAPLRPAPVTPSRPSGPAPRPLEPRGFRRRDRKKKKVVDEKLVIESVRKTLASLDTGQTRRRHRRRDEEGGATDVEEARVIHATEFITVAELANLMEVKPQEVITTCMRLGVMGTMNKRLDKDTIAAVADEFGFGVEFEAEYGTVETETPEEIADGHQLPRPPVVTIMGHVDHGKTSLLDYIRKTNVIAGEAGGITQHIGAYEVELAGGHKITFLDTPGHEAFTAMRARGAQVTDVVVLVVAADDRVMPQTVEAIDHAKAANVPIVVAINKIDLPTARPDLVKQELASHGVMVEAYGGKTVAVEISAKKGTNVEKLLELILLQAEVLDLKANPDRTAEGAVVEAKLDKGRGPVATVLVQRGTLKVGDILVAGSEWGRVRLLMNDRGETVESAGPSMPVEVLGLSGVPEAGDEFAVVNDEARAREVTEYRARKRREGRHRNLARQTLDQLLKTQKDGEKRYLPLVLKTDVQGSSEAIQGALAKLGTDEVGAQVLQSGVGGITESDVILAHASGAAIIGFNVRANAQARERAKRDGVEIRYYNIIYNVVDDVKAALSGLLAPETREKFLGNAEVLEVFSISKVGKVAGCRVTEGVVRRGARVRLIRDNVVIHEGELSTLKRFKDEAREVLAGQECGMSFANYQDLQKGDVIECYEVETIRRAL